MESVVEEDGTSDRNDGDGHQSPEERARGRERERDADPSTRSVCSSLGWVLYLFKFETDRQTNREREGERDF